MKVITSEKLPIKTWEEDLELGTLEQAKNAANLPFLFKHVSIMPDTHQGYGIPIGCVLPTKNVIIPNAVGVDIGCGMVFCNTNIDADEIGKRLKSIMQEIREAIPVGFEHRKEPVEDTWMPNISDYADIPVCLEEMDRAHYQVGTLGGGNHFIELQRNLSTNTVSVMIHSGSRNLGHKVATKYNKVAIEKNEKWYSSVDKEIGLAFLPLNTPEGQTYLNEMIYCVAFADLNRSLMLHVVCNILEKHFETSMFFDRINKPHNFASIEHHFNNNVVVHRKGACRVRKGELAMIPGSQGSKSYIVMGTGEELSYNSCSHGAGRVLGRNQARKTLNLKKEMSRLKSIGTVGTIRTEKDLDEAPSAYKDIDSVMEKQQDLVVIVNELLPLATIKG